MSFHANTYANFISTSGPSDNRLFNQYNSDRADFDIIIIGSGMGGGILADDLADRVGGNKRILVIEAGSYLYPTHVYNMCRFSNADLAMHFECDNFKQSAKSENEDYYIGRKPQFNLGGRSIFWSGLIPEIQQWELDFFPDQVRNELKNGLLAQAGALMNESVTMGVTAQSIVNRFKQSPLVSDFSIRETPRALHQPYLTPKGMPKEQFYTEPTGVFNTAELLINQAGLAVFGQQGNKINLLLNHFVEDIQPVGGSYNIITQNTLTNTTRIFRSPKVVLAGGSLESPKLLQRSSKLYSNLPQNTKELVGYGLTDHPTTNEIVTYANSMGSDIHIPRNAHAKIIFYSRGNRDSQGQIKYPFNVEMNLNHEYWHLRDNDSTAPQVPISINGSSVIDLKFSFGNFLDNNNKIHPAPAYGYIPEVTFRNQSKMQYLRDSRFPALAGWQKSYNDIFAVLNDITHKIFSQFLLDGRESRPVMQNGQESWFGTNGLGFGYGTVHHAAGTLRMPYKTSYDTTFHTNSVVDENLQVKGAPGLYVCDMSVMPYSSAANPVRTLAALALRLSKNIA